MFKLEHIVLALSNKDAVTSHVLYCARLNNDGLFVRRYSLMRKTVVNDERKKKSVLLCLSSELKRPVLTVRRGLV